MKVEPIGLPIELGVTCESKKEIKGDSKGVGSSIWKDGVAVILGIRLLVKEIWGGRLQVQFQTCEFEIYLIYPGGQVSWI